MSSDPRPAPLTTLRVTADLRARWEQDGVLRVGRVLADQELDACRAEEAGLRSDLGVDPRASTVFWSQILRRCPALRRLAILGPHLDAVADLVGPDVVLWWNQVVTKLPDADPVRGTFTWHQDNGYGDVSPGTNLTLWVALDDVDTTNGCVWVMPGSHRGGVLPHAKPREDSWHLETPVEGEGVPVPLTAGDAVLFSGYTLHRSLANRSGRPRRAFFLQYAQADADVPTRGLRAVDHPEAWVVRGRCRPR